MTASAAPAVKPFEHGIPSILWTDLAEGGDQTTKFRREQDRKIVTNAVEYLRKPVNYKRVLTSKTKGMNSDNIPHYLGKSALEGFAKVQTGSAYWYATVALYNTSEKSARNAGKRRLIFEILKFYTPEGSYDDTAGSITALIYSPSHYGEAKSGSKPSFQLVVGHPFDLASLGSLYIPPGTSWADVA